jgi:CAAX prenyl protease-like protein
MRFNPVLNRIMPFAVYPAFLVLAAVIQHLQHWGLEIPAAWDLRWLYPAKIGLVLVLLVLLWRNFDELAWPQSTSGAHWVLGIVIGILIFVLWINLDQQWATMGKMEGYDPTDPETGRMHWGFAGMRFFGATLVVPVMEELFWRSMLMRWLDKPDFRSVDPASVSRKSFWLTALLFASAHSLWFAGLIAGLAYNWLYVKTRNLWVPIVSHGVTNGLLGIWILSTGNWQFW